MIWCAGFMTTVNLLYPRYMIPLLREFDGYHDILEYDTPLLTAINYGMLGSLITAIILTISRRLFKFIVILLNVLIILSLAGI